MPYYTNEELEDRDTSQSKKLHCGNNIPPALIAKVAVMLEKWNPETEKEKRDKEILRLLFIENVNAHDIARMEKFRSTGNRSKGKLLHPRSISRIMYEYVPEARERPRHTTQSLKKTNKLHSQQVQGKINKPRVCATCGSRRNTELHHIVPVACGGNNDYYNLVYLCHECHQKQHRYILEKLLPKQEKQGGGRHA